MRGVGGMQHRSSVPLLLLLPHAATFWTASIGYQQHACRAFMSFGDSESAQNNDDDGSLQSALKKAAAQKLGRPLEAAVSAEDVLVYQTKAKTFADAMRESKENLARRKEEIGEAAALEELDDAIRAEGRAASKPNVLKARPKLWLLDRDGCINEDVGAPGVVRTDDLRIIPGSAGALRRLRLSGKVAIITNQSCRGKGLVSAAELDDIHEELRHLLAKTARGGRVGRDQWDALYVCEDIDSSSDRKKPAPGMILEALSDFGCAPSEAVMIGDSWGDVVAAHRAGCVGVLLATGHGASLGALLRERGVRLPVTLSVESSDDAPATEFVELQRSLATAGGTSAAVEEWIRGRSEREQALIGEALRKDVRIYRDLAQAVDELVAMASEMPTAPGQ